MRLAVEPNWQVAISRSRSEIIIHEPRRIAVRIGWSADWTPPANPKTARIYGDWQYSQVPEQNGTFEVHAASNSWSPR